MARNDLISTGGRGLRAGLGTLGEFQKFILRGNVVDLAVGVVIGAAFNSVVQAFVNDFIQPLIGLILKATIGGNINDLNNYQSAGFKWGNFIGVAITFILTAAVVYFLVVKPINALEDRARHLHPKKDSGPTMRECPFCLSTVALKATRCAYCTAQLPPVDTVQAQPV